jgi:hypothetical protein
MTAKQFQNAIDRLGLSQVGAARLFGSDPRTARRWAIGERSVPEPVAIILRLMLAGKITADDIISIGRAK